jgi:hypothetical protein
VVHTEPPETGWYVPGSHIVHDANPAVLIDPARHRCTMLLAQADPAGHTTHFLVSPLL